MYHNPVGPAAATGIGVGAGLFAFTPLGMMWAVMAAFALVGAFSAALRFGPAWITEAPRALVIRTSRRMSRRSE